jgi:hypothetical protein
MNSKILINNFVLTKLVDPFGDLSINHIQNCLNTDLLLSCPPPASAIFDIMQIIQNHRKTAFKEIGSFQEELLHIYRNRILIPLIERDSSIAALHEIVITKGKTERRFFIPFVIRQCGRNLVERCFKPGEEPCSANGGCEDTEVLRRITHSYDDSQPFFTQEQVDFFHYIRKEEDIPIIREYSKAKSLLSPLNPVLSKQARSQHANYVEVDDKRSPSMGGIAGITVGGDIEKITSIVPSELAMMESDAKIDLFDINLLENRILSFVRDRFIDVRRHRDFHIVFYSPESLNSKPNIIPFRWQYFFMAIIFDIVSAYRNFFGIKHFPFHFVFPNHADQSMDVFDLIAMVHARDFPDVDIRTHTLTEAEIQMYAGTYLLKNESDSSVLLITSKGADCHAKIWEEYESTTARYGGKELAQPAAQYQFKRSGIDTIDLQQCLFNGLNEKNFEIARETEVGIRMSAIRDSVFLSISGARIITRRHT